VEVSLVKGTLVGKEMIARHWGGGYSRAMNQAIDPKLLNNPLFRELMAEGLAMQDRFLAEPVYAKTGTGFLQSGGVAELKAIKAVKPKASK
jgi:hypothetical protein